MKTVNSENNSGSSMKKWFTFSNISTVIMLGFIVAMVVNPNAKAFVIQNLMKVGLFQPAVPSQNQNASVQNVGQQPPLDIIFKDGEGKTVSLSDLKGKVVFLNFWATWCPPCIAEMPSINKLKKRYKASGDVVFLMVDADGDYQKSSAFMRKRNYDLPIYIAVSHIPEEVFGDSLPTTVILDKDGRMVFRQEGSADYENPEIITLINNLLLTQ